MNEKNIESKLYNNRYLVAHCGILLLLTTVLTIPTMANYFINDIWIMDDKTSLFLLAIFLCYYVIDFIVILFINDKRMVLKLSILQIIVFTLIIFDLILIL